MQSTNDDFHSKVFKFQLKVRVCQLPGLLPFTVPYPLLRPTTACTLSCRRHQSINTGLYPPAQNMQWLQPDSLPEPTTALWLFRRSPCLINSSVSSSLLQRILGRRFPTLCLMTHDWRQFWTYFFRSTNQNFPLPLWVHKPDFPPTFSHTKNRNIADYPSAVASGPVCQCLIRHAIKKLNKYARVFSSSSRVPRSSAFLTNVHCPTPAICVHVCVHDCVSATS